MSREAKDTTYDNQLIICPVTARSLPGRCPVTARSLPGHCPVTARSLPGHSLYKRSKTRHFTELKKNITIYIFIPTNVQFTVCRQNRTQKEYKNSTLFIRQNVRFTVLSTNKNTSAIRNNKYYKKTEKSFISTTDQRSPRIQFKYDHKWENIFAGKPLYRLI